MKQILLSLLMVVLLSASVMPATLFATTNNATIGQEFEVKIYAEEEYQIAIPEGCEATRYQDKVQANILHATIDENPTFRCLKDGMKTFSGRYINEGTWESSPEYFVNVTDPLKEIILKNISGDELNITTFLNESAEPVKEINIMAWVIGIIVAILLLIIIIFGIGIILAL